MYDVVERGLGGEPLKSQLLRTWDPRFNYRSYTRREIVMDQSRHTLLISLRHCVSG
jgi:hypothetical protein